MFANKRTLLFQHFLRTKIKISDLSCRTRFFIHYAIRQKTLTKLEWTHCSRRRSFKHPTEQLTVFESPKNADGWLLFSSETSDAGFCFSKIENCFVGHRVAQNRCLHAISLNVYASSLTGHFSISEPQNSSTDESYEVQES